MPRAFDACAEFPVDAATFVKDSTSAAYKAHQLRRLGNPEPSVVLSDTRRNGWHVTVRAAAPQPLRSKSPPLRLSRVLLRIQVLRNTPSVDPPWPVRRLLRGRKIEYIETRRRRVCLRLHLSPLISNAVASLDAAEP
jgi:hypothetical protein